MDYNHLKNISQAAGENKDCGVKAIAVCCEVSYSAAHVAMRQAGRINRKPSYRHMYPFAARLFNKLLIHVTNNYSSRTIRTLERELPARNFLVFVRRHAIGVKGGQVIDHAQNSCRHIKEIYEVVNTEDVIEITDKDMDGYIMQGERTAASLGLSPVHSNGNYCDSYRIARNRRVLK
jgi:hypothetical protein